MEALALAVQNSKAHRAVICEPKDVLRSYDGASEGAEPRNPWAASLPPMASRRKESAADSARRPVVRTVFARVSLCER